jgi:hypothetical protein
MTTQAENELLTEVGPGTSVGALTGVLDHSCPHRCAALFGQARHPKMLRTAE